MSDWGTKAPNMEAVQVAARALETEGFDVHTVKIVLNGQHGGWDVIIEATDEELEDFRAYYQMDSHGWGIEQTKAPELIR